MVDYGLKNKTAIITGTNNPRGIGAAAAIALAREGARVVLTYKRIFRGYDESRTGENGADRYYKANAGDASETEKLLRKMTAQYLVLEKDVSDEKQVKEIFDAAIGCFGGVDILVNNAAADDETGRDTAQTVTGEVVDAVFAVNVKGSLLMTGEFLRRSSGGGRVINLSTDSAQVFPGQICYGASKAALEALTRSIAVEAGKYCVTVNCVAPGPTQTGWIDAELERLVVPQIPMGRLILPEEIANAVLFLASGQAGMITGQVIKVSGGHAL